MLTHLDSLDRQLVTIDAQLEQIDRDERWGWQVDKLSDFHSIGTYTALRQIDEIDNLARFGHPRDLAY